MQPINMIRIYYGNSAMAVIWNTSCKNSSFEIETLNQMNIFVMVIIPTRSTGNLFLISFLGNT